MGRGTGAPTTFVPGGDGPGPTPGPTLGLYVRSGATGSGTEQDPGGDLGAALNEVQTGETVTILYSPEPLTFTGRLDIPDGVRVVGQADPVSGARPVVRGIFTVGSEVTLSGFRAEGTPITFDLSNSSNVTFTNMNIVGRAVFDNVSGRVAFVDSVFEGGREFYGTLSGVEADIVVSNCDITVNSPFRVDATGAATRVNFTYSENESQAGITSTFAEGAQGDVRIENNTLNGNRSGDYVYYYDTSRGNLFFVGNNVTGGNGLLFQKYEEGGGGTVLIQDNIFEGALSRAYSFTFEGGEFDLLALGNRAVNNASVGAQFGTLDDLNVQVERLSDLATDNTLRGNSPEVQAGVTLAPDGSTDLPPLP